MKKRAYSLIGAALAALALSCAQPLEPPASAIAEGAGRAVLTVSAGATGGARTILPATVPVFSRYEAEFSKDGDTVTVSDTAGINGEGVSQELTAGTWTALVKAYRRFTPTGGTDTEYLAARGSASVSVIAGQVVPVTVSIAPVPVADTADDGIFTYTVSFPDDVGAIFLTLTGGGTTLTETPVSGEKTSLELTPGYYDLIITLSKTVGTTTFTAGASEKAHIYSGLESEAVYGFTGDDFVQTIPFMGTLGLPLGVTFSSGTVAVYDNSGYAGDPVASAAIAAGKTFWAIAVPASRIGETLYLTLEAVDSEGTLYKAAGDTGVISDAGADGVSLTVTGKYAFLSHNTWKEGTIAFSGETHWYYFTANADETYYLQWDDLYNSGGGKTIKVAVSAYHADDGSEVFSGVSNKYFDPQPLSVSTGETIYVRVAGQDVSDTGTYAIRYYDPAGLPPQAPPSYVRAAGHPAPACVVTWGSVSGATGYKVYRAATFGGTYIELTASAVTETYYTDTTVTAGTTYYYKVAAASANGDGVQSAAVSATPPDSASVSSLSHKTWVDGTIAVEGAVDWYSFVAATAGTCYVQWDSAYNSGGDKTLYEYVSAYRSDGTSVFSDAASGYSYPQSVSVSAGETVYVRVAGQTGSNTGTYALRYYEPFTVTFDTDGGTSVPGQTVVPDGTATEPAEPTKANHIFLGWHKEAGLTTLWNFAMDTVTGNTTLYARWIPFKMVAVPVPGGGIAFPTGTSDNRTATVANAYELGETEVTYELWHTVRSWAESNGYSFYDNPGREGSSPSSQNTTPGANKQEPVTMVTWFDAVVWLNALTEWVNAKTGSSHTAVYYYDSGYATVAKNSAPTTYFEKEYSSDSCASAYVKPEATGFRLPTSNEWELAARWRGSDTTNTVNNGTFNAAPWFTQGDSASGATADYNDATETNKVAWYSYPGSTKKTQAVKGKAANALGLYDMSGNVWEWCFDWSSSGFDRIIRGGGWGSYAEYLRAGVVLRDYPDNRDYNSGFRPARTVQE